MSTTRQSLQRSRVSRAVFGVSGVLMGLGLGLLATIGGCEEQATTPPAAQGSNQGGGLSQNPKSLLGRSAKTAKDVASQAENRQAQASGLAGEMTGETGKYELAGLVWAVPTSWEPVDPASAFVAKEFHVSGDDGVARVTISHFKDGSGGSIDMNVSRWEAQFEDGATGSDVVATPVKRRVADCDVTLVSLEGTMRGGTPGGPASDTPDSALRGAFIQGPQGLVVVKMTGPKSTIEGSGAEWDSMIRGMTRKAQ